MQILVLELFRYWLLMLCQKRDCQREDYFIIRALIQSYLFFAALKGCLYYISFVLNVLIIRKIVMLMI